MESKPLRSAPPTSAGSRRHALWASCLLSVCSLWTACSGVALKAPTNDSPPTAETRVILVGLDGFRWDFLNRTDTPNLDRLAAEGIRAKKLLAAFPTKTFPNHYTLVTGLWPSNHGIVGNNIRDPELEDRFSLSNREAVADARWWGGEPIWVTAEKEGLKSAPLFWPGSEAAIQGVRPTYWEAYQHDMSHADRVDKLLSWIDLPPGERPRFLTLYASDVDTAAHDSNPDAAPEVGEAVARVDAMIGRLLAGLEQRGLAGSTHVIVVSDHGMAATSANRVIPVDDYIDLEVAKPMDMGALLTLWPEPEDEEAVYAALNGAHPRLEVYRRDEIPARFHFADSPRIAPIVGVVADGWSASTRGWMENNPERLEGGSHGYDPDLDSMGALFIAHGPALRQGLVVEPFRNIHLYELMCHILGLEPAKNDGDLDVVREMLR